MKLLWRLGLFLAALACGYWLWLVLFPTPEKLIRSRVREVASSASFENTEGPVAKMINAEKLAGYFASDAKIYLEGPETGRHAVNGRDEIVQAAVAVRSLFSSLAVKFVDVNVKVLEGGDTARVELTARVQARGETDFLIQELLITFKRLEGEWLITRVETMKTLS
jgi:hypothetical protein